MGKLCSVCFILCVIWWLREYLALIYFQFDGCLVYVAQFPLLGTLPLRGELTCGRQDSICFLTCSFVNLCIKVWAGWWKTADPWLVKPFELSGNFIFILSTGVFKEWMCEHWFLGVASFWIDLMPRTDGWLRKDSRPRIVSAFKVTSSSNIGFKILLRDTTLTQTGADVWTSTPTFSKLW